METKRQVFERIARSRFDDKMLSACMEQYDNAPDDKPDANDNTREPTFLTANDNTRKQQIKELARELFVRIENLQISEAFDYAEEFFNEVDERNKETDK